MPKADTIPTPSRRAVLTGSALTIAAAAIGIPAVAHAAGANPDAELIATCGQHIVNRNAYNNYSGGVDDERERLWDAYDETRDFISDTRAQTIDGIVAKIKAAKAEATSLDGDEDWEDGLSNGWAVDCCEDLLRLVERA
jgi:hypothetical protein